MSEKEPYYSMFFVAAFKVPLYLHVPAANSLAEITEFPEFDVGPTELESPAIPLLVYISRDV